jgi:RND superfamily putative drug exporter
MAGQMLGSKNVPSYDPGQAGRAERVLSQPGVQTPPSESVLIQAHAAGAPFASDPQLRQAVQQVVTALRHLPGTARDIRSPLTPAGRSLVSADGRSALVTFTLAGDTTQAVTAPQDAVAAIQARFPGLTVAEADDTSLSQAITASVRRDRASVPRRTRPRHPPGRLAAPAIGPWPGAKVQTVSRRDFRPF